MELLLNREGPWKLLTVIYVALMIGLSYLRRVDLIYPYERLHVKDVVLFLIILEWIVMSMICLISIFIEYYIKGILTHRKAM